MRFCPIVSWVGNIILNLKRNDLFKSTNLVDFRKMLSYVRQSQSSQLKDKEMILEFGLNVFWFG